MSEADEYRKRALEAEAKAEATVDSGLKAGFIDVAKQLRAMADQIDARAPNRQQPSSGGRGSL